MALAYQRQVRDLFFGLKNVASNPTATGDVAVVETGEGRSLAYIVQTKEHTGKVVPSDEIVFSQIKNVIVTKPVKKVGDKQAFVFAGTPTNLVGETVSFTLKLHRRTHEDTYVEFAASRPIQTGDTAKIIMEDIAGQFAYILGNDFRTSDQAKPLVTVGGITTYDNKYFTITTQGRLFSEIVGGKSVTKTVTPGTKPVNQGYQLLVFEDFLTRGRAEFDTFTPGMSLHRDHQAAINAEYYTVDVSHFLISRDDPKHSDKMLTVAFPTEALATAFAAKFAIPEPVAPGAP